MSTAQVNGVTIYYELHGEGSTETVALLNGVMASASSWAYYTDLLTSRGYRVLLHDFRGQLLSEKPAGPYRFADHREDFLALCRHLGIERCHLVGTSYGGEMAMRIALDAPGLVQSLVLIDSVSELDALLERFVNSWIDLAETGDVRLFYRSVVPSLYSRSFLEQNAEMIDGREARMAELPGDYLRGQAELYRAFLADVPMTGELPGIRAPALVVCGEEDILKPTHFSRIIAEGIPEAALITLPDCGHVAVFEKPAELASLITGFLGGIVEGSTKD